MTDGKKKDFQMRLLLHFIFATQNIFLIEPTLIINKNT